MSTMRRNKQKGKKAEKAQRIKDLLSPDSLPIVYTDLRRKVTETKPLAEFLAWAKEEKVLVFTQAYHKSLFLKASSTVGTVKILCPAIESDCTSRNGIADIAEAFYADRNALFVDDMYSGIHKKATLVCIKREKALRTQTELLESEAACRESNKTVEDAVDCESRESNKTVEESNKTVEDAVDCESSKLVDVASEYENAQDAYREGSGIDGDTAEFQRDVVECFLNEAGCQQAAKESIYGPMEEAKANKGNAQGRLALEDWLLQLEKGKKAVPYDQILIQLLKSDHATTVSLDFIKNAIVKLSESLSMLHNEVNSVHKEVKSAHKAISDNGESIVRISLAQFLQEKWGQCAKKISVPIFGRKLPFVYFQPLEDLAKLCLTGEKKSRSPPMDVEIDIFVKVVENAERQIMYTPPIAPYRVSDELSTEKGFTSFIIGEITRSGSVCKDAYSHPLKADYSGCTKLLYKFIQVERALIATRQYYYVDEEYMEAGLIVSPSFKNMSNAHELIDRVLEGRVQAFANIARLHAEHRMWLTSM